GSALAGGLVVGVLFTVAIATGLIRAPAERPSQAAPTLPVRSVADGEVSVSELYERTSPGVAFVTVRRPTVDMFGLPAGESEGAGSGFVIDDEGHIITNAHVVEDANS